MPRLGSVQHLGELGLIRRLRASAPSAARTRRQHRDRRRHRGARRHRRRLAARHHRSARRGRALPPRHGDARRHRLEGHDGQPLRHRGDGRQPAMALVGLALPGATPPDDVEALYAGMRDAAARHGVASSAETPRRRPADGSSTSPCSASTRGRRAFAPPPARETRSRSPGRSAAPPPASPCSRPAAAGLARGAAPRAIVRAHLRPCARAARGPLARSAAGASTR